MVCTCTEVRAGLPYLMLEVLLALVLGAALAASDDVSLRPTKARQRFHGPVRHALLLDVLRMYM
jgi:NhaP-type Na+/H+ or K+/H+ antiporter